MDCCLMLAASLNFLRNQCFSFWRIGFGPVGCNWRSDLYILLISMLGYHQLEQETRREYLKLNSPIPGQTAQKILKRANQVLVR